MRRVNERVYKLQRIAGSYYVCVPPQFLRDHGLEQGDEVRVLHDGEMRVIVGEPREEEAGDSQ